MAEARLNEDMFPSHFDVIANIFVLRMKNFSVRKKGANNDVDVHAYNI